MVETKPLIILGIDPGYARCGWGVVSFTGNQLKSIDHGVIETKADVPFADRLLFIHQELERVIQTHKPHEIAVEQLYFSKNVKTAIDVGQARGVILLTCAQKKVVLAEYKPVEIKQAVTGFGHASKQQIKQMIKMLLNLKELPHLDDAADALAVAICHSQFRKSRQLLKKSMTG